MINVLFVCLGNICRSPSGEGVFKSIVESEGLSDSFFIDSAGTSAYHIGERADHRMRSHARKRKIELTSRARQFTHEDFDRFDYILAMDESNLSNIMHLDKAGRYKNKVKLMNEYSKTHYREDVPDPYYGGADGFERVLDMLEESCRNLLEAIKDEHKF